MRTTLLPAAAAGLLFALPSCAQTKAATSCSNGVTFQPIPGYVCGAGGTLKKPAVAQTIQDSTVDACAAACLSSAVCRSIGFESSTNTCTILSYTLARQGYTSNTTSTTQYWNPVCFKCAPPISSSTSSATTKPTSTSTKTKASATSTKTRAATITTPTATQAPGAASTCTKVLASAGPSASPYPYIFYARTTGFTESLSNPGNDNINYPPITVTLPKTPTNNSSITSDCDAIAACAQMAVAQSYVYYSFDVHFLMSEQQWRCTMFYDPNWQEGNAGYFSVGDADVGVAYGYYNTRF